MSDGKSVKTLPVYKRVIMLLLLGLVSLGAAAFGLWLSGAWPSSLSSPMEPEATGAERVPIVFDALVLLVIGVFVLAAGFGAYFIVLATHCFTFDFTRPVFAALKPKLYMANIVVGLLLIGGLSALLAAPLVPVLASVGLSRGIAVGGPLLGIFLLLQMFAVWFQMWAPLEKRMIIRRLSAYGASPQQLAGAILVGISDPARSSFKKLTLVEDDIGALWITPQALFYRGDADHFDVQPEQFIAMERKADAGSTSALAGAVHVLIRFRTPDGRERTVRFHDEGGWTLTAKARTMDRLADQIARWEESRPRQSLQAASTDSGQAPSRGG